MNPKYTKDENGKELLTVTEKKDNIIVQKTCKQEAEIITGAITRIQKGLNIPPVKYKRIPS